ncbi:hypothetical protein SGPA1_50786 [Streptomyces misionensis JCM 4497]
MITANVSWRYDDFRDLRNRPHRELHASRPQTRPGRRRPRRHRGGGAAPGARRGAGRPHRVRRPGARRGARTGGPARRHHVLEERLHPPHPAVPGQVPLLHLRHRPRQAAPRRARHVHVPGRGAGHRPQGRGPRLQGSPDHPR